MQEKVAIMYSGGLDSYIAYHYAKKMGYAPVAIWVGMGCPYDWKEKEAMGKLDIPWYELNCDVLKEEYGNLPTPDNWIIPGRNLLIATIGAMFAKRVWICALDGEMHKFAKERDKSPEFYHLSSGLLTYVFDIARPETIVETPFAHLSKTEIVTWALHNGVSEEMLLRTSTCYDGERHNCGECGTCFKRWIAMKNNGVVEAYVTPPWENMYARRTSVEMWDASKAHDFTHYSDKRIHETMCALEAQLGGKLADYINESREMLKK
jgi:7-cyano-7-deazaguanine synthase